MFKKISSALSASKSTPLGKNIWFSVIAFGLIGQVAWIIETMYFSTFAQNLFSDHSLFGNMYFISTTLMVIFSALTATATTIFVGGLSDRIGKRKVFITGGYIIWGVTIMLFAAIPINFGKEAAAGVLAMLVVFDCIMTFFGSSANDAAFNTWVTDVTDVTNRGKVNGALSLMPILATVVAVIVAMFTFDKGSHENPLMFQIFFIIMGLVPMIFGLMSMFTIKDVPNLKKNVDKSYLSDTFYGFRPSVIKKNKMMYVNLSALCIIGISQQVFLSYMLNFIIETLGITNYIPPFAVVIVVAAIITGVLSVIFDKKGRKNFYIPGLVILVLGLLVVYLMKFMPSGAYLPILIVGGSILMGSMLALMAALMSGFQDYLPDGYEGRFQGVRMCFSVLIPMIVGPLISLALGINTYDPNQGPILKPPFEFFLAAAIVAVFAIIPIIFIVKDSDRLRKSLMDKVASARTDDITTGVATLDTECDDNQQVVSQDDISTDSVDAVETDALVTSDAIGIEESD